MTVYVVMGNDYPEAVFATAEAAEAFCAAKRKEPGYRRLHSGAPRIYWRVYDFELREE